MIEEQLLIHQLKQGKDAAYRLLYEKHYAVLCHLAREWVGDDYTAESLVGDVIFHLWEIRESLEIRVSLRSYLLQAVRNRDGRQPLAERYIQSDDYPLGRLLERELEYEINRSIAALPAECRQVFLKSRFERKKYEEIAAELGVSVNTVKYHIKNALARLHDSLGKYLACFLAVFLA